MIKKVLMGLLWAWVLVSGAAMSDASKDALAPKSDPSTALTTPLKVITVSTNSLTESLLFYRDAMGLSVEGPLPVSDKQSAQLREVWGIDEALNWQTYRFYRPNTNNVTDLQLLVFDEKQQAIHKSWSAQELGTFSMGFPNDGQLAQDQRVRKLGFGALNKIEVYQVPRTDGSRYSIEETIFNGPDFVHAVGIHRADGMSQLGELDGNGLGGPAYSALVVEDAQKMIDFFESVLGWELRSDRQWKSAGTKGALNIPDGTEFRFAIMYSQGAATGHILLVEYLNIESIDTGVPPRLPNRGIGMWTIETKDIDLVLKNARDFGAHSVAPATRIDSPIHGTATVATLLAPNGLLIELVQRD